MPIGSKKTWLGWIGFGGFILLLTFAFRFGGFYYGSDRSTALLAQNVKDNKIEIESKIETVELDIKANELDIKANTKIDSKQTTAIAVLETQFENIDKKLDAILRKL